MTELLVFFDKRFIRQVIPELRLWLEGLKITKYISDSIIIVECAAEYETIAGKLNDSVFIDRALELASKADISKGYTGLEDALVKLAGIKRVRIEVLKEEANDDRNAKSIEVELGRAIEQKGAVVSLSDPEMVLYVIISQAVAYVCRSDFTGAYEASLDRFRHRNVDSEILENGISRAEFKLYEAINYFGISLNKGMRVLDVGAAPGGWSRYMISKGASVVAIDAGIIEYAKMPKGSRIAIILGKDRKVSTAEGIKVYDIENMPEKVREYDLLHIVELFGKIKLSNLEKLGPFDMACIDVNIPAQEAAGIATICADALTDNGTLILTLKMTDDNIEKNIEKSSEVISGSYKGIRVKKLPHDRKELTLFARKL